MLSIVSSGNTEEENNDTTSKIAGKLVMAGWFFWIVDQPARYGHLEYAAHR
jgi:hypothetical protein